MEAARRGDRWTEAEEDHLLSKLFDQEEPEAIAAAHQRSVVSILLRVEQLVDGPTDLADNLAVSNGPEANCSKGRQAAWPPCSAGSLRQPLSGHHLRHVPRQGALRDDRNRGHGKRLRWDSRKSYCGLRSPDCLRNAWPAARSYPVLARHDAAALEAVGIRLFRRYGTLELSDWVLDCDWLDVERLTLTPEQIVDGSDEVSWIGAELLRAALVKYPSVTGTSS